MAERFREQRQQISGRLDTTGTEGTQTLANALRSFSRAAGEERKERVVRRSLRAGQEEGAKGNVLTRGEFSLADQAFNKGLRAAYIAETDKDVRENINRLEVENALDPQKFEASVIAMEQGLIQGIEDSEIVEGIRLSVQEQGESAMQRITQARRKRDRDLAWTSITGEVTELDIEAQQKASEGDFVGAATSLIKGFSLLDEAAASGFISFEVAENRKKKMEKASTINQIRYEVERDFEGLESFGAAIGRLEDRNIPKDFTPQEWESTKKQIQNDLKAGIDRDYLQDAEDAKALKESQEFNFDTAYIDMINGDLTSMDIRNMALKGEISGAQAVKLSDRLSLKGRGIDSPTIVNDIERKLSVGDYKGARDVINNNWGSDLTDDTARKLLQRIDAETDPASLLSDPGVNRERNSLKMLLGFQDQFSAFFDPAQQQRIELALDEYNVRVAAGDDPRAVKFDLLNKNVNPSDRFEALRNPRFSDQKEDIGLNVRNLQKAFDKGQLSQAELNTELRYLKEVLEPALKAKREYESILSENSKQVKAAQ